MASLMQDNLKATAIKLSNVNVNDDNEINSIINQNDLAFYTTIAALTTLNRREMREKILSSSKFKTLMESVPEISDIIEHFLNGRYADF